MKVAEVECLARSRRTTHRVPSGRKYLFRSGQTTEVTDLTDARYFAGRNEYEVSWTARGKLMSKLSGESDSVGDAIASFSYGAKQELAKTFGIAANQSDEELQEQLTEVAEELEQEMETY